MSIKTIKVVFCANSSWYLYNFRKTTIKAFVAEGYKVYCVAPQDDFSEKLESIGVSFLSFKFESNSLNLFKELKTLTDLIRIYLRIRQDYTFNFTPKMNIYSSFAAMISNSKIINNISGLGSAFIKKTYFSILVLALYRISSLRVEKVFFQNKKDMNLFLEKNIIKQSKSELIYGSGVDLNEFYFSKMNEDHNTRFILMSRLLKEKGVYLFAEAAKELKKEFLNEIEFAIAGFIDEQKKDAVTIAEIKKWEQEGILNYLGPLDDVKSELSKSHCAVLPTFYPEGLPKFLLEAAAMGKIIVSSNTPGCSEVVEDGINGYLCEPQSLKDLVLCLKKVVKLSGKERNKMFTNSRHKAEKMFSDKVIIKKYLNCIQNN